MLWHPERYGPTLAPLFQQQRRLVLAPQAPAESVRTHLERLTVENLFPHGQLHHREAALACLSGLWLYFDFLDESHSLSQQLHTPEGSFWHAIMHRREQDFGNSRYWFHQVGQHPIFPELARQAAALATQEEQLPSQASFLTRSTWDAPAFVTLCAACVQGHLRLASVCEQIQGWEWRLLFDHCWGQAQGSPL
jgi:hypothetical protein